MSPKVQCIFRIVYNVFLLFLLITCFVPCCTSLTKMRMMTGVLKIPYKIVFAPFIAATATIGPISPPSIPMVIYAMLSGASIGKLFMVKRKGS